jgi:hypothetical protein
MLLAAAAAAVGVAAAPTADAAGRRESFRAVQSRPTTVPPAPNGNIVLYDQLPSASPSGALSAQFSSSSGAPYDSEGADDFVVPAAGWRIATAEFAAFPGDKTTGAYPTTANVRVYSNSAGVPSTTVVCNYPAATVAYDGKAQIATVVLPTVCDLTTPGTYWISYQPIYDFIASGGDYYWNLATPQAGVIGQWRNPGDGFESGCVDWSPNTSCGFTLPDYAFRLSGVVLPVSLQSFSID